MLGIRLRLILHTAPLPDRLALIMPGAQQPETRQIIRQRVGSQLGTKIRATIVGIV